MKTHQAQAARLLENHYWIAVRAAHLSPSRRRVFAAAEVLVGRRQAYKLEQEASDKANRQKLLDHETPEEQERLRLLANNPMHLVEAYLDKLRLARKLWWSASLMRTVECPT
jgi:hypothetical protein